MNSRMNTGAGTSRHARTRNGTDITKHGFAVTRKRIDITQLGRTKILFVALVAATFFAPNAFGQTTTRISVSSNGDQTDRNSERPDVSADGRYVAFESKATNLVAGDTNAVDDIFVYDRSSGVTVRISVHSSGAQANGASGRAAISADGRYVTFYSDASNLVDGDTATFDLLTCIVCTGFRDIFLHDRDPDGNGVFDEGNATTVRISVNSTGAPGDGTSTRPAISADGQLIAFRSKATNLVTGDVNGLKDVFVYDVQTGITIRASRTTAGAGGNAKSDRPSLSADGRFVTFYSDASNLVSGDTNAQRDIFVYELNTQTTVRVSVGPNGAQSDGSSSRPRISDDGRYVAFRSSATNLVTGDLNTFEDVFIHDRDPDENGIFDEGNGLTELVSAGLAGSGNGNSSTPSMSADARYVAFHSDATNLVDADQNLARDVFLLDRQTGNLTRIALCGQSVEADGGSARASLSSDAGIIAFHSDGTNLVANDTNGLADIFVRDRQAVGDDSACVPPQIPPPNPPQSDPTPTGGGGCGALGMITMLAMISTLSAMRLRRTRHR